MTATARAEQVPSRWQRHLERLVFGFPVAFGVTFLAIAIVDRTVVAVGVIVAGVVVGLVWTVALAAAVYLDADAVAAGDAAWEPNGAAYAAVVLVLPAAALHYLYVRYRHVRSASGSRRWWYAAPATTLVLLAPFPVIGRTALPPEAVLVGPALSMAVLPPAVYRDAAYLRSVGADWQPDPATHLVVAVLATLTVVAQPAYVGYYLARRWRAVGFR